MEQAAHVTARGDSKPTLCMFPSITEHDLDSPNISQDSVNDPQTNGDGHEGGAPPIKQAKQAGSEEQSQHIGKQKEAKSPNGCFYSYIVPSWLIPRLRWVFPLNASPAGNLLHRHRAYPLISFRHRGPLDGLFNCTPCHVWAASVVLLEGQPYERKAN